MHISSLRGAKRRSNPVGLYSWILYCTVIFLLITPVNAAWYSPNWPYRIKLTIDADKVNGDLSNFPVYVNLNDLNGTNFFDTVQTGGEIRVTKSDGTTEVARELVHLDKTSNAGELHFVANGTLSATTNSDWYMYYGNSNASAPTSGSTYGSNNVWTNNYAGVWHMQENPAQDGARQFTAANNEYLEVADNADISLVDGTIHYWTIWLYLDSKPASMFAINKYSPPNRDYYIQWDSTSDRFELSVYKNDGSTRVEVEADTFGAPEIGKWYFITCYADLATDTIGISVNNGSFDTTTNATLGFDGTAPLELGRYTGGSQYWNGKISKLGFWKRALTSSEITYLFNKGNGRNYNEIGQTNTNGSSLKTSLISYWNLDEASGNSIDSHGSNNLTDNNTVSSGNGPKLSNTADTSGNGYHGTLNGFTANQELTAWSGNTAEGSQEAVAFDQSGNHKHGTLFNFNANPRSTDRPGAFSNGNSLNFDAASAYIETGDSTDHNTDGALSYGDNEDWSVAFWIKTTDSSASPLGAPIVGNSNTQYFGIGIADNKLNYSTWPSGSWTNTQSTTSINDNTWHHCAVVNHSDETVDLYVDGTMEVNGASASVIGASHFTMQYLGRRSSTYSNIKLDDMRIYGKSLNQNEVNWLNSDGASGTNPTNTNLDAHWDFDEANTRSLSTISTGTSMLFNGASSYVEVNESNWEFAGDMSITFWVKFNNYNNYQNIISTTTSGSANSGFWLEFGNTRGFTLYDDTVLLLDDDLISLTGLNTDQWYHIAIVRNGTGTDNLKGYIDGALFGEDSSNAAIGNTVNNLLIAKYSHSATNSWLDGAVDDLRIYNDALSASERAYIYTDGALGTNPGTSNLQALWAFDDGSSIIKDSSPNQNHSISFGNIASSGSINGTVGKAINLDGANDYLFTPGNSSLNITSKLSIEAWAKLDATGSVQNIYDYGNPACGSDSQHFIAYDSTEDDYYLNWYGSAWHAGDDINTSPAMTDTNWHQVIASYDTTTNDINMCLDSSCSNYSSADDLSSHANSNLYIGNNRCDSSHLDGAIDEFRISNSIRSINWAKTSYNNQNSSSNFYSASQESLTKIVTYNPADNDDNVSNTTNLVMTFDRNVDIQTGNIYIRKSSDDSLIESIAVNSAALSGNGTTTITVNPSNDLPKGLDLYINIDPSTFNDSNGNPFAGISNNGTWNFTTQGGWDSGAWSRRIPITIKASQINGDLSNFPIFVNLGDLPDEFFDLAAANGADLRVTKNDGTTKVAREITYLDKTANAGELHFVANGTLSSSSDTTFYLYYGNSNASEPAANSSYGSQNVWVNNYTGVWHMHQDPNGDVASAILDSTSYGNHASPAGSMTSDDLATNGQLSNAIEFDGTDDRLTGAMTQISTPPWTMSTWVKLNAAAPSGNISYIRLDDGSDTDRAQISSISSSRPTYGGRLNNNSNGTFGTSWHPTGIDDGSWHYLVGVSLSNSDHKFYVDGSLSQETSAGTLSDVPDFSNFVIAGHAQRIPGKLDEGRIINSSRSANWISAEYNNQNSPSSFYDNGAIETSTIASNWYREGWSKRTKLTINAIQVNGDLSNFPIYVNLADLNGELFFNNVDSNGADIRITKSDGVTEVAREIVSIDTSTKDGEMHFIANGTLSGTIDTIFYIYYGNTHATEPAANSTYGSHNVWTNNYVGIWHLGENGNTTDNGYADSSSSSNHGNGVSMLASSDVAGKLAKAQDFDGSADYIEINDASNLTPTASGFSVSAWSYPHSLETSGSQTRGPVVTKTALNGGEGNTWEWNLNTHDFSAADGDAPWSFITVTNTGNTLSEAIDTSNATLNQWQFLTGTVDSSGMSRIYLNGLLEGNGSTAAFSSDTSSKMRIGFEFGASNAWNYDGLVDEVRVSNTNRSINWIKTEYNNQNSPSTFYTVGEKGGLFDWNLF